MRIMSCQRQIRTGKDSANEYATREDFCRAFTENLNGLYQLSYLLTGDDEKAQQCFVAGFEDSVKAKTVLKDWALSWAKRTIIKNAIRALQPQPADSGSSLSASVVSDKTSCGSSAMGIWKLTVCWRWRISNGSSLS
jgi:hypothetical protein